MFLEFIGWFFKKQRELWRSRFLEPHKEEINLENSLVTTHNEIKSLNYICKKCSKQDKREYEIIGKIWALELRKINHHQQIFARKAINDILFEGQMGLLHRHSIKINSYPSEQS